MKGAIVAVLGTGAALVVAAGIVACDGSKAKSTGGAAPSASASAAVPAAKSMKFVIDPKSRTSIEMLAPKEHIKAGTDGALGTLELDPSNLGTTRGEVRIDLTTLSTRTSGDAAKDKTQTVHARTWLEVADGEEGKLPDELKAANRYAVYAIRAVENLSATSLAAVPAMKDGAFEVRAVNATTRGDLTIHGQRVERAADVEVRFYYPAGSAPQKPSFLTVKATKAVQITLSEHDVKPRDGLGKIAKGAFNLLGTKVGEVANVTLDLRANPES